MSDITLSKAVRSNLLNLQSTATQLGKTQERLATGQRVNSALDNPTNFFTASSLNSRASDMSQLLDSMSNGIQTIEAADNGLTAITKTLESMQSTLTQARQDKSFKATSYDVSSTASGNLSFSGGAVGSTAANVSLEGGAAPSSGKVQAGAFSAFTVDSGGSAATAGTNSISFSANSTAFADAAGAKVTGGTGTFDLSGSNTIAFDLSVDGVTQSIAIDATQATAGAVSASAVTADELAGMINADFGANVAQVNGTSGALEIVSGTTGATNSNVTIASLSESGVTSGLSDSDVDGTDADTITFSLAVDGEAAQPITIGYDDVAAVGNTDGIVDDNVEFRAILQSVLTAAGGNAANVTIGGTGDSITLTSDSTGTNSSIAISSTAGNATGPNNTGSLGIADNDGSSSKGTADSRDLITFNIAVDGASTPTAVTLTAAQVAAVGDKDQTVDSLEEFAAVVQAGLTAAGVTGVTVGDDGTGLTFKSATTGTSSSVAITGAAITDGASGTSFTLTNTGLDSLTATAGAATGGPRTVDELVSAINGDTTLGAAVRASNDNGKLRIENLSTSDLTVTGYNSTSAKLDGGSGTATIGGNTVRADLATQYNTLRDQLDKLSDDASFNGVNLLRGDKLQITFNETSTSEISIQAKGGKSVNSANLGIQTSLKSEDLDSDANIDSYIGLVKNALGSVRSQASSFGSNLSVVQNRQDFTKNMINTLQTGASNLTLADSNEEAANLLALQTRQQLSSTALSLASQSDQNVLRLF